MSVNIRTWSRSSRAQLRDVTSLRVHNARSCSNWISTPQRNEINCR